MKHTSVEPPKKKLKQARLPFQILSPGVKSPAVASPQPCKRKASEDPSDDDAICEITEIKENQLTPVEKKPKLVNGDKSKEIDDAKCKATDEDEEEEMDVGEENVEVEKDTKLSLLKQTNARLKSVKTPKSIIKKKTPPSKGKTTPKVKSGGKKAAKTHNVSEKTEPKIVDFVDLSESPCKSDSREGTTAAVPKYNPNDSKDKKESVKGVKVQEKEEDQTEDKSIGKSKEIKKISENVEPCQSDSKEKDELFENVEVQEKPKEETENKNSETLKKIKETGENKESDPSNFKEKDEPVDDVEMLSKPEEKNECETSEKLEESNEKSMLNKSANKDANRIEKAEAVSKELEAVKDSAESGVKTNSAEGKNSSIAKEEDKGNDNKSSNTNLKKGCAKQTSLKDLVTTTSSKPSTVSSPTDVKLDEVKQKNDLESCEHTPSKASPKGDKSSPVRHSSPSAQDESLVKTPSSVNKSVNSGDISPSSACSTPVSGPSTPASSAKKSFKTPSTTPRRLTPKQLLKIKEKEEKLKEKERLKQEREMKKAEEREEKLKQKKEKEEEKLKIKQEKEEKLRKEKEEKEKKRQAEIEQKNEEKRLKEEEKRAKLEEKRAKEEEKRKKEEEENKKKEEKRLKEEQKQEEKRKSAQAFASFFVKSETKSGNQEEDKENEPVESHFQPFEVKNDMRLAPLQRVQLSTERRQVLDSVVENGDATAPRLYLEEVRSPSYVKGSAPKTFPAPDETDDDVIFIESEKPNEEMEVDIEQTEIKTTKKRHRPKLLQFHENRRPPYWGTWRKKSKFVRPRAPLSQDKTMFEYDIDSDDEWEEPEDGESLRGSEDEESQDEYEEDNEFFVPHGYLSDEEGQDEFDDKSPETMKAKLKLLQMEFEAERSEKQEKLKPRLIGCVWFCNSESDPAAVGSHIAEWFLSRRAVWEGSLPVSIAAPAPSTPTEAGEGGKSQEETRGCKKQLVQDSMIPDIIKKLHGSRRKLTLLMAELLEEQKEQGAPRPSKKCLADKIREMASWTRPSEASHACWFVKDEVREAHGLSDLTVAPATPSTPATPATNITKFTKVLTTDERLKMLRELPTSNTPTKEGACATPSSKPSTLTAKQSKTPSIKLAMAAKPSPTVKKRISLTSVGLGQPLPKQSPSVLETFVKSATKCEDKTSQETTTTKESEEESLGKNEQRKIESSNAKEVEREPKVKKRITPVTLTSFVSKTPRASTSDEVVVLSD